MDKTTFLTRYADVFEHASWIAERAFADLQSDGSSQPSAQRIHAAMVDVFRAATHAERMKIIQDHPNLAGKLAQAKRLTAASSEEQAGVGLDVLTDEERTRFDALNARYKERFGFPFIIAVKDHSKARILTEFAVRVKNDAVTEFNKACLEVERIAFHRINALAQMSSA